MSIRTKLNKSEEWSFFRAMGRMKY